MSQSNNIINPGEILLKDFGGTIQVHAFNVEKRKTIHIGTVVGICYEKVCPVLQKPEPSFSLTRAEYAAILETGAEFIRIVTSSRSGTYSISVQDFGRFGVPYHNAFYGDQLRVSLSRFTSSSKIAERNTHTDNPKLPTPQPLAPRERSKQFDFSRLLDR